LATDNIEELIIKILAELEIAKQNVTERSNMSAKARARKALLKLDKLGLLYRKLSIQEDKE